MNLNESIGKEEKLEKYMSAFIGAEKWDREKVAWNFVRFNCEYRKLYRQYKKLLTGENIERSDFFTEMDVVNEYKSFCSIIRKLKYFKLGYFIDPMLSYKKVKNIMITYKIRTVFKTGVVIDWLGKYGPKNLDLKKGQLAYVFETNRSIEQQASECAFYLNKISHRRKIKSEPKEKILPNMFSLYLSILVAKVHGFSFLEIRKQYERSYSLKGMMKKMSTKQMEDKYNNAYLYTHANKRGRLMHVLLGVK